MVPDDPKYAYAMHLGQGICAGKTVRDVHRVFLLWSQKPIDREGDSFNVTKAFRRLTAFAEYQHRLFDKYFSTPIDPEAPEEKRASEVFKFLIPQELDAATGAVVWIIDLSTWDISLFENLAAAGTSYRAIMRYNFALMVRSMWDDDTATTGVTMVEAFGDVGFRGMLRVQGALKPIEADMNAMFYGVMPFKMKAIVLVGCPWWMSALLAFMRLFISKKMSQRINNLSAADAVAMLGGGSALPDGFLAGTRPYVPRYPGFATTGSAQDVAEHQDISLEL
jgi:hypothetical protein